MNAFLFFAVLGSMAHPRATAEIFSDPNSVGPTSAQNSSIALNQKPPNGTGTAATNPYEPESSSISWFGSFWSSSTMPSPATDDHGPRPTTVESLVRDVHKAFSRYWTSATTRAARSIADASSVLDRVIPSGPIKSWPIVTASRSATNSTLDDGRSQNRTVFQSSSNTTDVPRSDVPASGFRRDSKSGRQSVHNRRRTTVDAMAMATAQRPHGRKRVAKQKPAPVFTDPELTSGFHERVQPPVEEPPIMGLCEFTSYMVVDHNGVMHHIDYKSWLKTKQQMENEMGVVTEKGPITSWPEDFPE